MEWNETAHISCREEFGRGRERMGNHIYLFTLYLYIWMSVCWKGGITTTNDDKEIDSDSADGWKRKAGRPGVEDRTGQGTSLHIYIHSLTFPFFSPYTVCSVPSTPFASVSSCLTSCILCGPVYYLIIVSSSSPLLFTRGERGMMNELYTIYPR